jgi:hypothetical protein
LALDDFTRRIGYQPHDGLRRYAFTAAGFSHNAKHLALVDMKCDIVHRLGDALKGRKMGFEILDLKKVRGIAHVSFRKYGLIEYEQKR